MLLDPDFSQHLAHLDLRAIETSADATYAVDDGLVIRAVNPAFVDFGLRNGFPDVRERSGPGSQLLAAIDDPARAHLREKLRSVLANGEPWHHTYLCSSPEVFRRFRQSVYPLPERRGLLVSNHLVAEAPSPDRAIDLNAYHVSPRGVIVQCCHCRKVRNWSRVEGWDWVPSLVAQVDPRVSHSYCEHCLHHYYPDFV
jgi:hypothetical protein